LNISTSSPAFTGTLVLEDAPLALVEMPRDSSARRATTVPRSSTDAVSRPVAASARRASVDAILVRNRVVASQKTMPSD
jgi:hypothetical protein